MTGISAYGAYVPYTRLPLAMIVGRPAKENGPEKAVAYYDEDSVTMGVAAAIDCLKGLDRSKVDAVIFASTSYSFGEKQGAVVIAKATNVVARPSISRRLKSRGFIFKCDMAFLLFIT